MRLVPEDLTDARMAQIDGARKGAPGVPFVPTLSVVCLEIADAKLKVVVK